MNNILKMIALALAILLSAQVFASEPTPAQTEVAEAEAQLKAAQQKAALEKEMARSKAKAEWASKTHLEAWQARGQAVVDGAQYAGGKALQGLATVDGYIGYGVTYPMALVTDGAFKVAAGSKDYAAKAWDNEETQVAVKTETE